MEFRYIDEVEEYFTDAIREVLGEDRGIELDYLDGANWDISTNIAMKYRDGREVAEKLASRLPRSEMGIEEIEISEKNHLNIVLHSDWRKRIVDICRDRGLDICTKTGGSLALNPSSPSDIRLKSYSAMIRKIGALRGVEVNFSPGGEVVELGDMTVDGDYSGDILRIAGISRSNRTDIEGIQLSSANDMKNPSFRWSYIDYRLGNIAEILEKEGNDKESAEISDEIWELLLCKMKLKKALDESLRFKDPFKFYDWMEKYLEKFYSLKVSRETFTPDIAMALTVGFTKI